MSLSGHTKIQHTLIGMGSAALAATVPYPGKADRFSRKEQRSTKKKKKIKKKKKNFKWADSDNNLVITSRLANDVMSAAATAGDDNVCFCTNAGNVFKDETPERLCHKLKMMFTEYIEFLRLHGAFL